MQHVDVFNNSIDEEINQQFCEGICFDLQVDEEFEEYVQQDLLKVFQAQDNEFYGAYQDSSPSSYINSLEQQEYQMMVNSQPGPHEQKRKSRIHKDDIMFTT